MKRAISLLLSAALLLGVLSACRQPKDPTTPAAAMMNWSAAELAEIAFEHSGRESQDGLEAYSEEADREWLEAYIGNAYGIEDTWLDAAVIRATGASAFEIAVLKMADSESAVRAVTAFSSYIFTRQGDFAGYAPEEADMAANGSFMQDGRFAALFICPDPDGAYYAVDMALNGEPVLVDAAAPPVGATTDVGELRDYLVAHCGMEGKGLELLDDGDPEALASYAEDAYGLPPDQWEECAIARDTGDTAFEIAVFRVEAAVGNVEQGLNVYLNGREAQFDSSTDNAKLLHQAITIIADKYVVMLACPDSEDAANAFMHAAGTMGYGWSPRYQYLNTDSNYPDRCAFTAPNKDDMSLYDTSAILAAWETGDPVGLSKDDRKIYDAAQKVLKEVLKDGMSDYEKEVAIYGWIVNNVNYDWTHQDRMKETPRVSFEPYGGLVNHTAVCLGYATTFQLLMDIAGVECITIVGAAFSSMEDHAWNMVRLNGQWYCVDVTWDANMREQSEQAGFDWPEEYWNYLNVTSDSMADENHQWDYANTPEATAEDRGRS